MTDTKASDLAATVGLTNADLVATVRHALRDRPRRNVVARTPPREPGSAGGG